MSEQLTPEWHDLTKYPAPEWAKYRAQDSSGYVCDFQYLPNVASSNWLSDEGELSGLDEDFERNPRWKDTLVTIDELRAKQKPKQDQSTDANSNQANKVSENNVLSDVGDTNVADSQAIPKGFTHWAGGTCPVGLNEWVSVVLRIGTIKQRALAGALFWDNSGSDFDIIAYRLVFDMSADNVYMSKNSDQLDEKLDIPVPAYNPPYEMMGSALIDDVVANNVESFNRLDDVSVKREITPPQYNPDDVAFKTAAVRIAELEAEIVRLNDEDTRKLNRFIGFHRPFDEAGIAMDKPLEERIQYLIESRDSYNEGLVQKSKALSAEAEALRAGVMRVHGLLDDAGIDDGAGLFDRVRLLIELRQTHAPAENASLIDQRGEQYRAVVDDYEQAQSYLEEYAVMENDDTVADRVAWLISEHKRLQAKVGNLHTQVANLERTVKFGSTGKPERYISVYSGTIDVRQADDEIDPLISNVGVAVRTDGKPREIFAMVKIGEIRPVISTEWVPA